MNGAYWVIWICLGIGSAIIANNKGHNAWLWGLIGFFLPPGILITLLLKDKNKGENNGR